MAFWGELYSYIFFLFKMVGNIEIKPMRKSTDKVFRSYRSLTDFSSPRARPALTVIYAAGMRPTNVAEKKIWNGISTIGDAKLMKRFGNVGVILRNNI